MPQLFYVYTLYEIVLYSMLAMRYFFFSKTSNFNRIIVIKLFQQIYQLVLNYYENRILEVIWKSSVNRYLLRYIVYMFKMI